MNSTLTNKNTGLAVAAVLFLAAAIVQLIRLFTHFSVIVNGMNVPVTASIIGLIVYGALSYWFFKLRKVS